MSEATAQSVGHHEKATALISRLRTFALVMTICGLLASNLMTLVSDSFHKAAYGALTSLVSMAGEAFLSRLIASSPTAVVERKLEDSTRQLKRELGVLDTRNRDLEMKHRALQTQHATLKAKSAKRSAAMKKFSIRTFQRVTINKERKLASLPARAVPYVGIAAIVAMTGYELYSDCEMLKEMNELSKENELDEADAASVCGFKVPTKDELWRQVKSSSNSTLSAIYERLPALSPSASPKPAEVAK
jgi:hypothetical protein